MHRVLALALLAACSAQAQVSMTFSTSTDVVAMSDVCGAVRRTDSAWVIPGDGGPCVGVSGEPSLLSTVSRAVAYTVKEETDGIAPGVYVQVFNSSTWVSSTRRKLDACGDAAGTAPAIAQASGGQFVVACVNASLTAVIVQTYASDGTPAGDSFEVSNAFIFSVASVVTDPVPGSVSEPAIAIFEDGTFVVSWLEHGPSVTVLYARHCTGDGSQCLAPAVEVHRGEVLRYHASDISFSGNRVVLTVLEQSGGEWSMMARFLNSMSPDGGVVKLLDIAVLSARYTLQAVMVYSAGFLVAWTDTDGSEEGVKAQIFLPTGEPVGTSITATEFTENAQYLPALTGTARSSDGRRIALLYYVSETGGVHVSSLLADFGVFATPLPSAATSAPASLASETVAPPTSSPVVHSDTSAPTGPALETPGEAGSASERMPMGAIIGIVIGASLMVLMDAS